MGNSSDDSQLKYTVCGVPVPTVKWGFIGNSLKNTLRAATRNDTFYAHDYVLYLTPNLCEKMVHFEANGYNGNTYSWEEKIKKRCKSHFLSFYGGQYLYVFFRYASVYVHNYLTSEYSYETLR